MTHWLMLPIVLPAFIAPFIILAARYHIPIQRVLSLFGALALVAVGLGLSVEASSGDVMLYRLSDWAAPGRTLARKRACISKLGGQRRGRPAAE